MCWNRCNCAATLDHLLSLYNNQYLSLPFPLACGSKPICGKERTLKEPFFSRRSSFTYTPSPLPILSLAQFLPLSLAFRLSLWWPWRGGFFSSGEEGGCWGNSSRLTLLWEESRFFWHQWSMGGSGGWCGVGRGIDRRRLLWMAIFCSTLQQSHVLQQAYTCSRSSLDSHIYYLWEGCCMCTHIHKVNTIAFGFVGKVKMCGNYVRVASGIAGSCIHHDWNLLLLCVPDILRSESPPHISAGVFVQQLGNTLQLLTV